MIYDSYLTCLGVRQETLCLWLQATETRKPRLESCVRKTKVHVWQGKGCFGTIVIGTGDTKYVNVLKNHCHLYTLPSNLHFRHLLRTKETVSMTCCVKHYIFCVASLKGKDLFCQGLK